jgi:hypothetical protein
MIAGSGMNADETRGTPSDALETRTPSRSPMLTLG